MSATLADARIPESLVRVENGGEADRGPPSHLSYSRIRRFDTCPESYRLHYVEGLRPRATPANLVFGQCVHVALAHHFRTGGDPVARFDAIWLETRAQRLQFAFRDSWEGLRSKGTGLLARFMREERAKIDAVDGSEKPFELVIDGLDAPLVGVIDLVARVDGARTVVDFKTAASGYDDHEAALSDQLSAYALAEPEADRVALCVLVKTREPRVEWHVSRRTGDQLEAFLQKAAHVGEDIARGRFHKRPGKHCRWCEFLPVCLGDSRDEAGAE